MFGARQAAVVTAFFVSFSGASGVMYTTIPPQRLEPQVLGISTVAQRPSPTPEASVTSTPIPQPPKTVAQRNTTATSQIPATSEAIPLPSPTHPNSQLDEWFTKYAQEYRVDRGILTKIAACESRLNPGAVNGSYGGMYQFASSSWTSARNRMHTDPNAALRFNAEESIKTAAFKISRDGTAAWPNCD